MDSLALREEVTRGWTFRVRTREEALAIRDYLSTGNPAGLPERFAAIRWGLSNASRHADQTRTS